MKPVFVSLYIMAALSISVIAAWIGFMLYSYWYSSLNRQPTEQLQIGNMLPDFELQDVGGQALGSQYNELQSLGVRVALISPQPQAHTIALAKRFNAPFDFLTDEGNRAAQALGIDHAGGLPMGMQVLGYDSDTVLPTVIITAKGGQVLWTHETDNYRVRPEPNVYLAVLRPLA